MSGARRYPKPEVLTRLALGQNTVIEASAGTGKTYTLEHMLLELLLVGRLAISEILVVTFTEKATFDLKRRLREKLVELAVGGWPEAAPGIPAWTIDDEARALLERALFGFEKARISTIHAFCQSILTEQAFRGGRLLSGEQIDERALFGEAYRDVLRTRLTCDRELEPYLRAWLASASRDLEAVLYAAWTSRAPIGPRFDPAALDRAVEHFPTEREIAELASALKRQKWPSSTALTNRLSKIRALIDGAYHRDTLPRFLEASTACESNQRTSLLRLVRTALPGAPLVGSAAAIRARVADYAAAWVPLPSVVAQRFLPLVGERLERMKSDSGRYDFQDMLSRVAANLAGPEGDAIARALRGRYRYALVDEFQDTDDVQWSIFRRIFFESGGACPIFVIGDPKQAIYGFRGADVHVYAAAKQAIVRGGGQTEALDRSFRATPELIRAQNLIFDQRAAAPLFSGTIRYDHPAAAGRQTLSLVDATGRPQKPVVLLAAHPGQKATLEALGERLAREIRGILDGKQLRFGEKGCEAAIPAREIFVLVRKKREGEAIGDVLRRRGIPHAYFKQEGLFDRPEARHVRDLLAAIDDPTDRAKRALAYLTPFFGLSLADLRRRDEIPATHPLHEHLATWHGLAEARAFDRLFARILDESGVARRLLFFGNDERALVNIHHLFEILLEESRGATLRDLLHALDAFIRGTRLPAGENAGVQRLESERDAVQIMTVHLAKGLEASVVFLAGFGRSAWDLVFTHHEGDRRVTRIGPTADDAIDEARRAEETEEAARVLYVGVTRAKARLYLPLAAGAAYRPLADRLQALASERPPGFDELFEVAPLGGPDLPDAEAGHITPSAALFVPAPALFEIEDRPAEHERLRERHRGFIVTSYSALAADHVSPAHASGAREPDEIGVAAGGTPPRGDTDDLPGGKVAGSFLHDVIAELPAAALDRDFAAFARDTQPLFLHQLARFGLDRRHLGRAQRLVHVALTGPVRLPDGTPLQGIGRAARLRREVEFLYPIPEAAHPALGAQLPDDGLVIERGFIKGFIDALFESEGRVFLLDWKSDRLADWAEETLAAHVAEHYRLQADLYTLAVVKLLDVRDEADYRARFGGYLYCFLRGMTPDGDGRRGVHAAQPEWRDVVVWDAALRRGDGLWAGGHP